MFSKNDWNASAKDISDTYKRAIADAVTMGQTFLINPWFDSDKKNLDEVKRALDTWNVCGERCKAAGLQFGFHNHHDEFEIRHGDKLLYEIMLDGFLCLTKPDYMRRPWRI
jgi:sugar phosphate isomerase/epimerase